MPEFKEPGRWPLNREVYPHDAGVLIEQLRRFIGHDRLVHQMQLYRSGEFRNGVKLTRMRERQPLIEGFEAYEKATHHRRRTLRLINEELADLANVAAHYGVIGPTLTSALQDHHRGKLIDLNGQLRPLLLEWKTASHFARTNKCQIAWLDVDQSGPEFIANAQGLEWEAECKHQSQMITELLGENEADELVERILTRIRALVAHGRISVDVPDSFILANISEFEDALNGIVGPGSFNIELPGGIRLQAELVGSSEIGHDPWQWQSNMANRKPPDARLYAYSRAVAGKAVDPIEILMSGPRRTGSDLVEYLWDRKFKKAAKQCTGTRGAVLVFEWRGLYDPKIFSESAGIQALLSRTFDEHRHVAAISLRCDSSPSRSEGSIDYSVGAYLARSEVTLFPEVAAAMKLDGDM